MLSMLSPVSMLRLRVQTFSKIAIACEFPSNFLFETNV